MNQLEILKLAKKKRGLTVRDYKYDNLERMVHKGLLNKTFPTRGRGAGWPFYKISRRGVLLLYKVRKNASRA